jgi:heme exporter protein B
MQTSTVRSIFLAIYERDLRLALRRRAEALLPVGFFVIAIALFPLGVGPEPKTLRDIAAGVLWVCALFAALLSMPSLYASDHDDGSLEQMLLAGQPATVVAAAKAAAHVTMIGAPLLVAAPLLGVMLGMQAQALGTLVLSLLLGLPILSLLGGLGAALTLGLRGGNVLLVVLVLPLAVPALIFGAGAVGAVDGGRSPSGHLSLLAALLIVTAVGVPWATGAALRLAAE